MVEKTSDVLLGIMDFDGVVVRASAFHVSQGRSST